MVQEVAKSQSLEPREDYDDDESSDSSLDQTLESNVDDDPERHNSISIRTRSIDPPNNQVCISLRGKQDPVRLNSRSEQEYLLHHVQNGAKIPEYMFIVLLSMSHYQIGQRKSAVQKLKKKVWVRWLHIAA